MSGPDRIHAPGGDEAVQVGATLHLRTDSAVSACLYPAERRVVVVLGEWPGAARVDLYLDRAGLVRLRDFLITTVTALDEATTGTSTGAESADSAAA